MYNDKIIDMVIKYDSYGKSNKKIGKYSRYDTRRFLMEKKQKKYDIIMNRKGKRKIIRENKKKVIFEKIQKELDTYHSDIITRITKYEQYRDASISAINKLKHGDIQQYSNSKILYGSFTGDSVLRLIPKNLLINIIKFLDKKTQHKLSETCWSFYAIIKSNIIQNPQYAFDTQNFYGLDFYHNSIKSYNYGYLDDLSEWPVLTSNVNYKPNTPYITWTKNENNKVCKYHGTICNYECDRVIDYDILMYECDGKICLLDDDECVHVIFDDSVYKVNEDLY